MTRITLLILATIGGLLTARFGAFPDHGARGRQSAATPRTAETESLPDRVDPAVRKPDDAIPAGPKPAGAIAAGAIPAGAIEDAIVEEHNRAREEPGAYAAQLRALKAQFDGNYIRFPGEPSVITREGVSAVEEAIRYLENATPLPALTAAEGLSRAAADHVRDQGPKGTTGHDGSDGSKPRDRVGRHGRWDVVVGENLSYGPDQARRVVMGLIIDDGVPDRGHRHNIFNDEYRFIGVACGPHKTFRTMCAVDYAGEFSEESDEAGR